MRILLALWVSLLLSGPPATAQANDQVLPAMVIADVQALLGPLTGAPDILWSEQRGDFLSLGVELSAVSTGSDTDTGGARVRAENLRDVLLSAAIGPVSVQPVMNGITFGARVQMAGIPVATLWTLRIDSSSLIVLVVLPKQTLTPLSVANSPNDAIDSEAPPSALLAVKAPPSRSCAILTSLSARIASGEKPRLTLYSYRTDDGGAFTTLEAGDPALTGETTRVVDSQGFFQFADARNALKKMLASSECQ